MKLHDLVVSKTNPGLYGAMIYTGATPNGLMECTAADGTVWEFWPHELELAPKLQEAA